MMMLTRMIMTQKMMISAHVCLLRSRSGCILHHTIDNEAVYTGRQTLAGAIYVRCKAFAASQLMTAVAGTRAVQKVSVCIVSGGLINRPTEKSCKMVY